MMYYIVEEINMYKFGDIIKIYVQDMPSSKITQMGDWEVFKYLWSRRDRDHMLVGFTTTCASSAYHL
jgi:hypothetical protein